MRFLVCDDDATLLKLLTRFLEGAYQAEVLTASDGKACLDVLEKFPADLLILDFMMPKMNGIQLLEELYIRAKAGQHKPKVLLYSAFDLRSQARSSGADGFLRKPSSVQTLKQEVDRILGLAPAPKAPPAAGPLSGKAPVAPVKR